MAQRHSENFNGKGLSKSICCCSSLCVSVPCLCVSLCSRFSRARCAMIAALLALASACSSTPQRREAQPGMQVVSMNRRLVRDVAGQYQLFLPRDYSSSAERWPLILFLHGGG